MAKGARDAVRGGLDFRHVLQEAIDAGRKELARTPELLPVLREAGVVDAGGQGLIVFCEGCLAGLTGEAIPKEAAAVPKKVSVDLAAEEFNIEYPYCTEFVVRNAEVSEKEAMHWLESMGESLIVGVAYDVVKVHIHAKDPGAVLQLGLHGARFMISRSTIWQTSMPRLCLPGTRFQKAVSRSFLSQPVKA
jgi:dihydroxyacetone kinase-like predicted kinase